MSSTCGNISIKGFDNEKFKIYFKTFENVLSVLASEISRVQEEVSRFQSYVTSWCSKLHASLAINQLEFLVREVFRVYLNVMDNCMVSHHYIDVHMS